MRFLKLYFFPYCNFGDHLNYLIFKKIFNLDIIFEEKNYATAVGIGSLLDHFLVDKKEFDYIPKSNEKIFIFSSGFIKDYSEEDVNTKIFLRYVAENLILRGKLSLNILKRFLDFKIKNVIFGDGALLTNLIFKKTKRLAKKTCLILHYVDKYNFQIYKALSFIKDLEIIDIFEKDELIIEKISKSQLVISSALHPLIIADSLGIPNIWLKPTDDRIERNDFKFLDFYSIYKDSLKKPVKLKEFNHKNFSVFYERERARIMKIKSEVEGISESLYKGFKNVLYCINYL